MCSSDLFERPKRGFSVPIRRWLGAVAPGELIELIEQPSAMADLLQPGSLRDLVAQGSSDPNQGHRLWALLFLSESLRQFPACIR